MLRIISIELTTLNEENENNLELSVHGASPLLNLGKPVMLYIIQILAKHQPLISSFDAQRNEFNIK